MRRLLAFIVIVALLTAILGTAYAYDYSFTSQLLRYSDSSAYELIASSEMRLTFVALIMMELLADGQGEFSDLLGYLLFVDKIV